MAEMVPETAANGNLKPGDDGSRQTGLLHGLISITRSIRALLSLRLAELGLGSGQDEVLLALEPGVWMPAATLAGRLDMRVVSMMRLLEPLVAKGLVQREGEFRDAGRMMVCVGPAGQDMQQRVRAIWDDVGEDLFGANGSEALHRLMGALDGLQNRMNSRLAHLR